MRANDQLIREIARNSANHAVQNHARGLSPRSRERLRRRYYDSVYASLIVFEEVMRARTTCHPLIPSSI